MEYSIPLDPLTKTVLKLRLFRNVTNTKTLKEKLISGELECSLIRPSLIYDPFQIVVAANKAMLRKKTITKTRYTEILFNLSPSRKITQSLQDFGIDENCGDIIVAVLKSVDNTDNDEANNCTIIQQINGDVVNIDEIKNIRDVSSIKKIYNITDSESDNIDILDSIVSRIAIKE